MNAVDSIKNSLEKIGTIVKTVPLNHTTHQYVYMYDNSPWVDPDYKITYKFQDGCIFYIVIDSVLVDLYCQFNNNTLQVEVRDCSNNIFEKIKDVFELSIVGFSKNIVYMV
jgi:PKD repeat protein